MQDASKIAVYICIALETFLNLERSLNLIILRELTTTRKVTFDFR
jgi:hypothetical protein